MTGLLAPVSGYHCPVNYPFVLPRVSLRPAAFLILLSICSTGLAADLYSGTPTAITEPECIDDPAQAFLVEAAAPEDRFSLVARHMGADALDVGSDIDFGEFEGLVLTNLHVPSPRSAWQRARSDGDANLTSAFQLHCFDAGFFINAWQFAPEQLIDEGPHAVYAYSYSDPPPAFDGDESTDLAIQAELEVPWLYRAGGNAIVQTYFQLRFYDTASDKFLQMTMSLFDTVNVGFAPYADYARNDSLFVVAPLATSAVVTRSPYSAAASQKAWTGLRFFRGQITQQNFRAAIDLANRFCATRPDVPDCAIPDTLDTPLSLSPANYRISEFSLITEIFNADTDANGVSVGLHLRGLGLYRFH
ncbi:MAG: hypothetical protein ABI831_24040 [Betaproteobacteria bacterium]